LDKNENFLKTNFQKVKTMERKFLTRFSFYEKGQYDNMELLKSCVEDVESRLCERPEIKVFGRLCRQNRDVGFFSDESEGYRYSNQMMASQPLTENLKALMKDINERFGCDFNGILVNRYNDGNQTIGKHSDDESGLSSNGGVACLSYGAPRKFRIRNKVPIEETKLDILLSNGTLFYMGGCFQRQFTHEIPKETKVKDMRISFTFRRHLK
jgi:alkylated DNA repair dioxygenase AlkB